MTISTALSPRLGAVLIAAAVALGACTASEPEPVAVEELPAVFVDGVPAPDGDVVLTVTSGEDATEWDLATLGLLDQQSMTIQEPFLDEEVTFTGPLWSDVLRASGVDLAAATTVELVALDDFVADIPVDDATLDGLLLATTAGGDVIDIADGGPIRLIYPADNPTGENLNNWIWSIESAAVT